MKLSTLLIFIATFRISIAEETQFEKTEDPFEGDLETDDSHVLEETEEEPEKLVDFRTKTKLLKLLNCNNKTLGKSIEMRGKYWILFNYVLPTSSFDCHESVTYTTHADFTFLNNVEPLVDRWSGPVSLAVYAPGKDFDVSLKSIAFLRKCKHSKIRKYVSFHLFFEAEHFPEKDHPTPLLKRYHDDINCNQRPPYLTKKSSSFRAQRNLTYPINVARNLARQAAQTHYVFASDVELYPSAGFKDNFLEMIANESARFDRSKPHVFVAPVFELAHRTLVPKNKTQLQVLLKNKLARLFHHDICSICHRIPKLKEWIEAGVNDGFDVFASSERKGRYAHWEPFYVGTRADPPFDERLTWEGQNNKIPQAYSMCLLGYQYLVLDNGFLIHRPGIKKSKDQLVKFARLVAKTNSLLRNEIHHELMGLYGKRKGCKLY